MAGKVYPDSAGAKSGKREGAAITLLAAFPYQTFEFRNIRGSSTQSIAITGPDGWTGWHSTLGDHRIQYSENPIKSFSIKWHTAASGNQVIATVTVEVQSTNDASSVTWDADIEIGIIFA